MVGNNAYSDESGYEMPTRCHNDILLLRQILTRCCKIKEENIFSYRDISLSECHDYFKQFLNTIDKDSLIIIFYSGHGDNDGSLVFTDGAKLIPDEFRRHINSFSNDTVLFIDACYSGNNEGPLDFLQAEQPFKSDCIGIYSSLAHLTAKEISYQNIFFKSAIPFYRDVLSINHIEGNGYFTALPGLFFTN
jgi:Ni,Fe-hydrogenase maturation factor